MVEGKEKNNAASLTCFGGANKDLFGWLRYGVLEDVGRVSVVCHQFGQKADIANGQTQRVHLFFLKINKTASSRDTIILCCFDYV